MEMGIGFKVAGNAQSKRAGVCASAAGFGLSWLWLDSSCGSKPMRRSTIFRITLLALAVLAAKEAAAGLAVATDGHGHIVHSYGYPREIATQRVLGISHRHGWVDARLIAASDVVGYGAIAVAHKGSGSVIGVALGRSSPQDAKHVAIEQCRRAGGSEPKVRWEFKG